MANSGRTVSRYTRLWAGDAAAGYDLSGDVMSIGNLGVEFASDELAALNWTVKGNILGIPTFSIGPVNTIFNIDPTNKYTHDRLAAAIGLTQTLIAAIGVLEAPTYASVCYVGQFNQKSYAGIEGNTTITTSTSFVPSNPGSLNYISPWGKVVHPLAAETAANTGTTNVVDNGAATAAGGYLVWVLTALNAGTATISIDDSADGSSYSALSGATSGAVAAISAGLVQLGTTATVRRYLRWQLALAGGATSATFALAFVRG